MNKNYLFFWFVVRIRITLGGVTCRYLPRGPDECSDLWIFALQLIMRPVGYPTVL